MKKRFVVVTVVVLCGLLSDCSPGQQQLEHQSANMEALMAVVKTQGKAITGSIDKLSEAMERNQQPSSVCDLGHHGQAGLPVN